MRALILVCILFATATAQQPDSVPQFSLSQLDGRTLRSEELKDKIVVLDFWATWCENCVSEIPEFNPVRAISRLADKLADCCCLMNCVAGAAHTITRVVRSPRNMKRVRKPMMNLGEIRMCMV